MGSLGSDLMELSQIVSQVLMSELDRSLGGNGNGSTGSWLLVDDDSLGGDVSLNGGTWDVFGVLGNESTDFSLGDSESGSLTLGRHMECSVHGAIIGL